MSAPYGDMEIRKMGHVSNARRNHAPNALGMGASVVIRCQRWRLMLQIAEKRNVRSLQWLGHLEPILTSLRGTQDFK